MDRVLFDRKAAWKAEYEDTLYKIYDLQGSLAAYLFPHYGDVEPRDQEEAVMEEMNRIHSKVSEATLLLPMVKLGLLDKQEGMDIDFVISSLEANASRSANWKNWLIQNAQGFDIFDAEVHTAREDRNMLSIALGIRGAIVLSEKEVASALAPLLDRLHEDGLL